MDNVSEQYSSIDKTTLGALAKEIDSLAEIFENSYRLVELDGNTLGVCGDILTYANTKSPLHRVEPVVIGISKTNWQTKTPFVFPDRINFPFEKFPHVNYKTKSLPSTLCLARENIDDWYAEHTLKDYVNLVAQWLRDAAKGKLMKLNEDDEFEPQRNHKADCLLMRITYMDPILDYKEESECYFYSIHVSEEMSEIAYGNEQHEKLAENAVGVRLFAGKDHVDDTWYTHYPTTLGELYQLIQDKSYPFELNNLKSVLDSTKKYVYFQLALLRPKKIIGKNTRINYLCFRANAQDVINDNTNALVDEVCIIDFTDYLTAHYISKTPSSIWTKNITLLGCGAVGSKIAYHLHRSGLCNIDLIDIDHFLPHNVCRHALAAYHPGTSYKNKANALKSSLVEMFHGMPHEGIKAFSHDALTYLQAKDLNETDLIIDATASVRVMYGIDSTTLPEKTRVVRVALSEGGDVGVTYLNIDNTQPLADYYMEILRAALRDEQIYKWLSNEKKNSTENIRIGEGCHSNTMRISDDTISAHAALMASAIRHIYEGKQTNRILLSFAHRDFPGSMQSCELPVNRYIQFTCANANEWQVRIPEDLLKEIRIKTKAKGKNETGGYLFGHIDHKRKTIYALSHFMPTDSHGSKNGFKLGTSGLKDHKKFIALRCIGQMEYIGDWHSHPETTLDMSAIDIATCQERVVRELPHGMGVCVITKATQTQFFLIDPQEKLIVD